MHVFLYSHCCTGFHCDVWAVWFLHVSVRDLLGVLCMCVLKRLKGTEEPLVSHTWRTFLLQQETLRPNAPMFRGDLWFPNWAILSDLCLGSREGEGKRVGEKLLNEVIIVSSLPSLRLLHPVSTSPAPSPDPCIAFPVRTATRHSLFTLCSFP